MDKFHPREYTLLRYKSFAGKKQNSPVLSSKKERRFTMTKDMTEGKPLQLILRFSIPLIFGNLFQQMYNMADTIIVGQTLGLNALTAVGSTNSLNFLIIGFTTGTCSGLAIPVAQRFGAKDYKKMREFVANAAWLAILLAAVLTVLTTTLCRIILEGMHTPANIFQDAYDYFFIICQNRCQHLPSKERRTRQWPFHSRS